MSTEPKSGVAPRVAAAENLRRILDEGAHSNVLLDQPGARQGRERAAVQRLTLDALRWMPLIDWRLEAMADRSPAEMDIAVRNVLRVALTELHLGGDPHGVVDSAVEAVRVLGAQQATGFVNALCRRAAGGRDMPQPGPAERPALDHATPPWIWRRLSAAFGEAETASLMDGLNAPAHIGVRLRTGSDGAAGVSVDGIPSARYVRDRSAVVAMGSAAMVMDPASTAVAVALDARPGERILDVAAAPGNKTAALWDAMGGTGLLVAADAHPRRVKRASARMRRLGVAAPWVIAGGSSPPFRPATFDRVLIDAPCTGLGTLRRRPEIKIRLDPEAPQRMAQVQRALLEASLGLLRPGGRLIYSACTVFPEETTELVEGFGAAPPDLVPGIQLGDGVLLAPHTTGTDAMFVAQFER